MNFCDACGLSYKTNAAAIAIQKIIQKKSKLLLGFEKNTNHQRHEAIAIEVLRSYRQCIFLIQLLQKNVAELNWLAFTLQGNVPAGKPLTRLPDGIVVPVGHAAAHSGLAVL